MASGWATTLRNYAAVGLLRESTAAAGDLPAKMLRIGLMASIDPTPYRCYWQEQARREEEAKAAAVSRARAVVPVAVAILRDHGARRVWLIGSLPRGTFEPSSDLDFMTEGLSESGLPAARAAATRGAERWVDVLRIEDLDAAWRGYHERFGELCDG